MKNLREEIQELTEKLNEMHHSWKLVSATTWSEEEWANEKALSEKLTAELKHLVPMRITELESEKTELENKYPNFSKRLKYIFGVPQEVITAENRYNQINYEIRTLESYL